MDIHSTVKLHSGRAMPVIGLGTWQLTDHTADTVDYAIKLGYRLIDTSSDYGSQAGIGEAIRNSPIDRKDLFVTTKVEETDDAYEATKQYLGEMGLDYADLILIHRPPDEGAGEELWSGLIKAKSEGFTKDIGVSNYSEALILELIETTSEVPVVNQIEWSPFGHSDMMLEFCKSRGIIIQAYSPLTRVERLDDEQLVVIAEKYGKTPAQILIRWNLQQGVVPLPKASQRPHLEENIDVFDFEISPDDMSHLSSLNEEYSALGALPYI